MLDTVGVELGASDTEGMELTLGEDEGASQRSEASCEQLLSQLF